MDDFDDKYEAVDELKEARLMEKESEKQKEQVDYYILSIHSFVGSGIFCIATF